MVYKNKNCKVNNRLKKSDCCTERKVTAGYKGYSVEAVLDRLPTAEAVKQEDGTYIVTAEVFGDGIDMWLRSQGDGVEVL